MVQSLKADGENALPLITHFYLVLKLEKFTEI